MLQALGQPDRSDANFGRRVNERVILGTERRIRYQQRGERGDAEGDATEEVGLVGILSHRRNRLAT